MAYVDQSTFQGTGPALSEFMGQLSGRGIVSKVARLMETPFDRRYRQRTAAIAALRAKSDADLAAMGLTREDILTHVFSSRTV